MPKEFKINLNRPIKVKSAINHFNSSRGDKPKMTMESLSLKVFIGEGKSTDYAVSILSKWNNGVMVDTCRVKHCLIIASSTGYPLCDLLENYI